MRKKKTFSWLGFIVIVSYMAGGVVFALLTPKTILEPLSFLVDLDPFLLDLLPIVFFLCAFVVAIFIHLIIHEFGHLICGLLSGYKFCAIQFGSLIWIKKNDKLLLKKLSISGVVGGQCIMLPPDMSNGKYPFRLLLMGGILGNIIGSLLFFVLATVFRDNSYLSFILQIIGFTGLVLALGNGLPLRSNSINNDGFTALTLSRNPKAAHCFWTQLIVNTKLINGVRLKDMPEELFYLPSDEDMENSTIATMSVLYCNRLMDIHSFEAAYSSMNKLSEGDFAILSLYRNLMNCDRIFCELVLENSSEKLTLLLDKPQKQFMASMRLPSVIRTEYAFALLAEKDKIKAGKLRRLFERKIGNYPFQGEIESEYALLNLAETIAKSNDMKI